MRTCPGCGRNNPVESKFCAECGARLLDGSEAQEVRKTVSVVFCDVAGSTHIGENTDPETLRRIMTSYFDTTKQVLESHGGVVEKFIGDAVMAVFGIPQIHEDDALRAVRAAAGIRSAMAGLNETLERERGLRIAIRTGVNTGEVVAGDPGAGQALVTGDAVNVAARLEQAAGADEILIGPTTYRLVRDAVRVEESRSLELKGKSEPLAAFPLIDVSATGAGRQRRLDSPLVGRGTELALLEKAYAETVAESSCRLCTVVGTAGLGKSRLTAEFIERIGKHRTAIGRCLPYGDGITFWPILEIITQLVGLRDDDTPDAVRGKLARFLSEVEHAGLIERRIAGLIGIDTSAGSVEETFWAVRKLLESGARDAPLVAIVDDIHWAEPTLLDLLEYIANGSTDTPLLLLTMARPELLDIRPSWAQSVPGATTIVLEPITGEESGRLLENLLGQASLPEDLKTRIVESAEGTPLFVEEMLSMLIDEGKLEHDGGRWMSTADLDKIEVPPTIQALLSARLDRLGSEERQVLSCASVAGKTFWGGAVSKLWSNEGSSATSQLLGLVRKNLIQPDTSTLAGQDAFRFRHILIRDAAYEALPKEKRIDLHRRFAEWIAEASGDRAREYDEIVAYHLESAVTYARELGNSSDDSRAMATKAAELLVQAGQRAFDRGDAPAAANLFARSVPLTDSEHKKVEALLELVTIHNDMGMFREAETYMEQARQAAAPLADPRLDVLVELREATGELATSTTGTAAGILEKVEALLPRLEAIGDRRALAEAWGMTGYAHGVLCRAAVQIEALERSIAYAQEAGALRDEINSRWWASFATTQSAATPQQMLEAADRFLGPVRGRSRLVEVGDLIVQAHVAECRGDGELAYEAHRKGRMIALDSGYLVTGWSGAMETAWIIAPFGEYEKALAELEEADAELERIGEAGFRSTVLLEKAQILYELGSYDEAARALDTMASISWEDDIINEMLSRPIRAMLWAREGGTEEAVSLAREALDIYDRVQSDFVLMRARALLGLSETCRLVGAMDEARSAAEEALLIYQAKEHLPWCERIREHLGALEELDRAGG